MERPAQQPPDESRPRLDSFEREVSQYLQTVEATRRPLLRAEEEVELAKTIEAGLFAAHLLQQHETAQPEDWIAAGETKATKEELEEIAAQGEQARVIFIESNLGLAIAFAKRYKQKSATKAPFIDLISAGNVGVTRAVAKFDYTLGYKFSTYATAWVRKEVSECGYSYQEVRRPLWTMTTVKAITQAIQELGETASHQEIARHIGGKVTPEVVQQHRATLGSFARLDQEVVEGLLLGDCIADPNAARYEYLVLLESICHILPDVQQRQVVACFLGIGTEPHSKVAISRQLRLPPKQVSQLLDDGLAALRQQLSDDPAGQAAVTEVKVA